jgi:hypothetical protein
MTPVTDSAFGKVAVVLCGDMGESEEGEDRKSQNSAN